jgi:hypothetical protein
MMCLDSVRFTCRVQINRTLKIKRTSSSSFYVIATNTTPCSRATLFDDGPCAMANVSTNVLGGSFATALATAASCEAIHCAGVPAEPASAAPSSAVLMPSPRIGAAKVGGPGRSTHNRCVSLRCRWVVMAVTADAGPLPSDKCTISSAGLERWIGRNSDAAMTARLSGWCRYSSVNSEHTFLTGTP